MRRLLLVTVTLALASGCESPEENAFTEPVISDSAGVRVVVNPPPGADAWEEWTVADTPGVVIGAAEGARPYLLEDVTGAAVLPGGGLVVADGGTRELRFYDDAGSHVTSVGGEGRGPGEFIRMHLAGLFDGDSLLVVDQRVRRGAVYDAEGRPIRTFIFDEAFRFPMPRGVLDGGRMVADPQSSTEGQPPSRPPGEVERPALELEIADPQGAVSAVLGPFPGNEHFRTESGGSGGVLFGRRLHVAGARDRIAVANDDAFRVRVYDASGRLLHVNTQPRTPVEIRREHVDAEISELVSEHRIPAFRERMAAALRSGPRPSTLPALESLHVDRERNVWVREFLPPPADSTAWQVFGPEGLPKGRVSMPGSVELLDADRNRIVVLARDPSGMETVQRFEIERDPE